MPTRITTQDLLDKAVTAAKLAIPTTKGDLLGFGTSPARLPIGKDGQILTVDLSEALAIKWATVTIPVFVESEVPSGTINGVNAIFTLANTPASGSVRLFKNGLRQSPTVDYTISTSTITFVSGNIPQTNDVLLADYRM